jgi:predicted house-cleaning noncanonical NTP pyrophosphatase (MazG superfamily)
VTDRKLVRDLIPDLIRADGRTPVVEVLPAGQRRAALLAKVMEVADDKHQRRGGFERGLVLVRTDRGTGAKNNDGPTGS